MLLGKILLDRYDLNKEDLNKALLIQKETGDLLGQILINLGAITETQLLDALSHQLDIDIVDKFDETELSDAFIFIDRYYPLLKVLEAGVVPFRVDHVGKTIDVAVNRFDMVIINDLVKSTSYDVRIHLAYERDIRGIKNRFYSYKNDKLIELDSKDEISKLKDMAFETPIIKYLNEIISRAVELNASDIHIEPYEGKISVRFRVDGVLHTVDKLKEDFYLALVSRIKLLSSLDIAERRLPQDGKFSTRVGSTIVDIRTSTIPTVKGEDVVVRLLYRSKLSFDIKNLGLLDDQIEILGELIKKSYGMLIITGPTGSGKTTTLYTLLNMIKSDEKKIITVEDPVEYQIEGLNQIQVKSEIGFNFANALRSILRHDPDVIMVGEIRDKETAEIAIQSALTGHLLLSTLHTNDAASALFRLLDMGIDDYLINASMVGIVAQRIVRQNCPFCSTELHLDDDIVEKYNLSFIKDRFSTIIGDNTIKKGVGCDRCLGTGYRGRKAIYEIIRVDEEIKELFIRKRSLSHINDYLKTQRYYRSLKDDGFLKVLMGITTIDEVLRVAL